MSRDETTPIQMQGREVGEFAPIPTLRDVGREEFSEDVEKFALAVVEHCESLRQACMDRCKGDHFTERLERDNRRAIGNLKLAYDEATGKVVLDEDDGYAFYGLTMGLSSQGIRAVSAYLRRRLLLEPRRPYALEGRGQRLENPKVEKLLYAVLDDLLERGHFDRSLELVCNLIPRQSLTALRYEMAAEPQYVKGKDGVWEEGLPELAPSFQVWPAEYVFVSNLKTPFAEDQEAIFWVTPEATLGTLQADEAIYVDGSRVSGKFENLDALRDEASENVRQSGSDLSTAATIYPCYTLVEMEGDLPMQYWAERGDLTPEVAAFFGMDVGLAPNVEDEAELSEWARKLGRIAHWEVAYLSGAEAGSESGGRTNHLLRCEPNGSKRPRHSLFVFRYFQNGLNWYGQSLPDLGQASEKAVDLVLNAKIRAQHINANPPYAVDVSAFKKKSVEGVQEWLATPGSVLEITGNKLPQECVQQMLVSDPPDGLQVLDLLKSVFEDQTGVRAATKGMGTARETGTLGEIQIDESKNAQELDSVVHAIFVELGRLISCLIEDFFHYMPEDSLLAYCERVSGMARSEIQELLPTVDGIERELRIVHPMSASNDAAVLTTLALKVFQLLPDAFPDHVALAKALMEVNGFPRGADLAADTSAMDPEDEMWQMRQGTLVEPDPVEDFADHLNKHMTTLRVTEEKLAQGGEMSQEDANLIALLPGHIADTQGLMQAVQMMQMAAAAQPGAPGVATKEAKTAPGRPAGPPAGPAKPQTTPEMASDIQGKAKGVAQ